MEKPKEKHIIFVICGIPLAEIHVHDVNNTQATRRIREHLARAVPVLMFLSTIVCLWVMVGILYNPPPLVKELSESILINFGKGKTLALEEQLKNAKDKIQDLQGEIEKLKREGLANFTREQQILDELSKMEQENEALSKNVTQIPELKQNLEICMKEKTGFQKSYSDSQKRENVVSQELVKCNANEKRINDEIKQLKSRESALMETLKAAEESEKEQEDISKKYQKDLDLVLTEKKAIDEKLEKTSKNLTSCETKNKQCQKSNEKLSSNLSSCQTENEGLEKDKELLSKDLSATKYTLGNCKDKNMDHEM